MISGIRLVSVAAASAAVFSLSSVSAVAAGPCVSGAQVSDQVHSMVAGLRDDVTSGRGRSALAHAMVDTLHTYRGMDANSAAQRQALTEQLAALRHQLHTAGSKVERAALRLDIKALMEQRERGAFTAAERATIRTYLDALRHAVMAKTDTRVEGQDVAAAFRSLHTQMGCRP